MKQHNDDPGNPEPLILLAGKYQERQNREKALELSKEAISLDPKGTRMMRRENGEIVSCREMAEYQYARTFVVTFGLIDNNPIEDFIRRYPASPLLRDAYVDSLRGLKSEEEAGDFYKTMMERFPHDAKLGDRFASYASYGDLPPEYRHSIELGLSLSENAMREGQPVPLTKTAKNIAQMYIRKENPEKAEEAYGKSFLSDLTKTHVEVLLEYAEFWLNQKRNMEDAEAALGLAVRTSGLPAVRRQAASLYLKPLGKADKALEIYGPEFLKTIQDNQADLYSYFNLWTRQKANEASALEALERLLQIAPDSVYYRMAAASALWTAGQSDKARAVFGPEYISKSGKNMNTLYEYGMFWLPKKTDMDQAVGALITSLSTIPRKYMDHWQTAEMLMKEGREKEALSVFGPDYLQTIADNPDALCMYADFWARTHKTNKESALQALEMASRCPGIEFFHRAQIAGGFLNAGKPGRAEDVYGETYMKTLGSNTEQLIRYAEFWKYANRNLFTSLAAARKACEVDPENGEAWRVLADVCVVTANPREGLTAVEKAISLTKTQKEREKLETLKKQIQAALEKK